MSMPRRSRPMACAITPVAPTRPIDRGRQPATNTASGRRPTPQRQPGPHDAPVDSAPLGMRRPSACATPSRSPRPTAWVFDAHAPAHCLLTAQHKRVLRGGMRSAASRCSTLFGSALTTSELLTLRSRVLFTFRSRYLFAIGLDAGILASLGWSLSAAFR